jgi:hypothetical protein
MKTRKSESSSNGIRPLIGLNFELNAVNHVSPKADHETNKGVPKAFVKGLYFARTKCWNSSTSLDGFLS